MALVMGRELVVVSLVEATPRREGQTTRLSPVSLPSTSWRRCLSARELLLARPMARILSAPRARLSPHGGGHHVVT